jgi:2,3-dihydroxybenzoate decarboxylase
MRRQLLVRKIALEEHFLCPGFEKYWAPTVGGVSADALQRITARLSDFGDERIEAMDRAGVARAVLSLAGPGVQSEPDAAVAVRMAAAANDYLRIAMPGLDTSRCRIPQPPPPSWSAACAISVSAAP